MNTDEKAAGSEPVVVVSPRPHHKTWSEISKPLPVGTKLYMRPDPRVAELEAEVAMYKLANANMQEVLTGHIEQNAALLVAIGIKQKVLDWAFDYDGDVFGVNHNAATDALTSVPSTELLEERDRIRDAKLIRVAVGGFHGELADHMNALARKRESGQWQLELGDGDECKTAPSTCQRAY